MYLAIDLGTTGCRSIIFDSELNQVAEAYEEYGLITPEEDFVEQDANLWWEITLRTAKLAMESKGITGEDILSISVSSQGISIVPVDKNINPLCNAISWLDVRAKAETDRIKKDFGEDKIFIHTGKRADAVYTLPKLLWLKENKKEIYDNAYKFLMPMDYLIAKFTGNFVTDRSMASGTLMYDIKNCCWSRKILSHYNISEEKLPAICLSGEVAGYVCEEVRKELSLSENCIVAVGAQDQKCAALGVGLDESTMTVSLGTAAAITKMWKSVEIDKNQKIGWCGYTENDIWVTEGVINTAGTCLRWVRDLFFKGENYGTIDMEAKRAIDNNCSLMFYPYMNGPSSPDFYSNAQGCFYGINMSTDRGCFAAAVMEGVAFQMRIILEAMKAYEKVNKVILFGGGAKGELWCRIIADVIGMDVLIPETFESAGAGAAILAARACGNKPESLKIKKCFKPSEKCGYYSEKYKYYRNVEKKLWGNEGEF